MVDVVIPVYGQADATRRCVESVLDCTDGKYRLIVIDDCSPDATVRQLARGLESDPRCVIIRNNRNCGFVSTANRGFRMSRHDVVILNSDTVVTKGWLEKMARCARSRPRVASVTPLTNNGTICAVPQWNASNQIPSCFSLSQYARAIEEASGPRYLEVPTGVGFCMYLTREALDEVGYFDEVTFPRGYGEENDWCMRASARGYCHLVDDATFVYHEGGSSFGPDRAKLAEQNYQLLLGKHPHYHELVHSFIRQNPLEPIQRAVQTAIRTRSNNRMRVVVCLHNPLEAVGGTEAHTRDLVTCTPRTEFVVVYPGESTIVLEEYIEGERVRRDEFPGPGDRIGKPSRDWWRGLLRWLRSDILHVQHLIGYDAGVLGAAKSMELPIVAVWHDFYFLCANYKLVNARGNFCNWMTELAECDRCLECRPGFPAGFQRARREENQRLLDLVDAHVFPSKSCQSGFGKVFRLADGKVYVIPHGQPMIEDMKKPRWTPARPLRVAFLGAWCSEKGSEVFSDVVRRLGQDGFEWHAFGAVQPGLEESIPEGVKAHGPFRREEVSDWLRRSQIDVVMLPSIWPETFSYTLSEAWQAGIPVIGSSLGAIGERIRETEGGWVVDVSKPQAMVDILRSIRHDPRDLQEKTERVARLRLPTLWQMGAAYSVLYRSLLAAKGAAQMGQDVERQI